MSDLGLDERACPSCGGAGGGPFGRAGSAWDDEGFVCTRCEGSGMAERAVPVSVRPGPGIVKADGPSAEVERKKANGS